jgi:hypothetical protein
MLERFQGVLSRLADSENPCIRLLFSDWIRIFTAIKDIVMDLSWFIGLIIARVIGQDSYSAAILHQFREGLNHGSLLY